jgi:hypothetical protein
MQVTLHDAGDLKAVSKALRKHEDGKAIRLHLTRELTEITRPIVSRVKAAWLSAPSRGHGFSTGARRSQPNLRTLLAKATRSERRLTGKMAGVRVRTDGRKMPAGMKALPGYAEGIRRRPWRHQVYGNPEVWVTQDPFPRFYQAAQPNEAQARQAASDAVGRVFTEIARAR